MEKNAEIRPGQTPDTEQRLQEKQASQSDAKTRREQTEKLDDDVTHRLSNAASK